MLCGAGEGDEKPWDGLVCSCSALDAGGVNGLVLRVAGHDYEMVPLNVFFHVWRQLAAFFEQGVILRLSSILASPCSFSSVPLPVVCRFRLRIIRFVSARCTLCLLQPSRSLPRV